jgi:hypothetical protein
MAVPKMPRPSSQLRSCGLSATAREASASMATKPPSPLLSARRMSVTYFRETMTVTVQKTMDSTP